MSITLTPQSIITASALLAAFIAIFSNIRKATLWVEKQNNQDKDIRGMKEEQAMLCYSVLACLKGLKELGCDGAVVEAIDKLEKHLNVEAHK